MEERGLESFEATGMRDDNINISDVIEIIETDLDQHPQPSPSDTTTAMLNGNLDFPRVSPNPISQYKMAEQEPYVKILEQPASKALRFRYECEGRSAGSIPGISSNPENKTFPTIQIMGFRGRAVVVVSCVTKDPPYRPHPHNLVGREGCKKGVCTLEVPLESMSVTFSNLGIQCVKKKDIEGALKLREEIRVDPFKTGFAHRNQPTSIDLNAVRLCFQVFITVKRRDRKDEKKEVLTTIPLKPVFSEPIYDKKAMCDLIIVKLSDCVSPVDGGRKDIILLCEKVTKEDIQVRFYEEKDGQLVWEGFGDFQPSQVHKQTAICFKAPRYKDLGIIEPVKVYIQLRRPSDSATSEPLPFEFLPLDSGKRKRPKYESDLFVRIQEHDRNNIQQSPFMLNITPIDAIKTEPRETTPSPYGGQVFNAGALSPLYATNTQQYRIQLDPLGPSPPPPDFQTLNANITLNPLTGTGGTTISPSLPAINTMLPHGWNVAASSSLNAVTLLDNQQQNITFHADNVPMNIDAPAGLSSFLDLDSQQLELKNLNSSELAQLQLFDTHNLSENLSNSLLLNDVNMPMSTHNNMTDSLTRLANNTIDSIYGNQK